MFQKPAFGANPGFSMQTSFSASPSTSTSPFGGFKPAAATSAFGAPPAFGAGTATQPNTGGGLFGGSATTGGGLFGAGTAASAAPAFGAQPGGFSFGAGTSAATGGLFANNASTSLFGNTQQNNTFGAKPTGFGFGSAVTSQPQNTSLFGSPAPATGLFGQNNTLGGGLFSNTAGGFGQQASGTGHVKYNPVVGSDVVVKGGSSQNISVKHHCITCMKEYEAKSLEELRLEDYTAGRKGNAGGGGMFPFQQQQQGAKPLFGAATNFGGAATTSAPSVFGGAMSTGGAFGQTNNSFSFGGGTPASTNTTGLFGASKPAFGAATTGTGLFGSTAATQAPAFGTSTASSFGFGSTMQNQPASGGLFGAKPATSVFGAPASTGFGGFGGGAGLFGAKPTQTQAPTFGAPQPGVGTQALGFGTSTSAGGGLFGAGFGKPAAAPAFGFGAAQPALGAGLGNAFQTKPATAPFGQLGTSNMFQSPATNNTFRTGLDSGLSSMFGNTSSLGGSALAPLGVAPNNTLANLSGSSAAGNVHEQILTLAARPYGDSPLFKDILPDSGSPAVDALRPTNPAAVAGVLERAYRASEPGASRLRLLPRADTARHKKSLFEGLEEYDASLDDKLSLKPSRKRLVLRPGQRAGDAHDSSDNSQSAAPYRSPEDKPQQSEDTGGSPQEQREKEVEKDNVPAPPARATETDRDAERAKRNISFDNNSNNVSSDRQGSWLSASKAPWGESKEKSIDDDNTPRIYPNLDKELPSEGSDRRASWLTTKPLRKPLTTAPQSAETSIRDLGLRPAAAPSGEDKENQLDGGNEPPHPSGVKLTRPGYYTMPTLDEMLAYKRPDGRLVVPSLTIGRTHYGNVYYDGEVDVTGLDLDTLVHFLNKEVIIYPEDADKPPVGEGLNKRAVVTLDQIWPRDKTENRPITDPDRLWEYEKKLRRVCDKHHTKFIEYRPHTGSWVFRVEHFSKYGLTDSDEEDDLTPDVMKRQLAPQALQTSAAPAVKPSLGAPSGGLSAPPPGLGGLGAPTPGLGGLGVSSPGLGGLGGLGVSSPGLGGLGGLGVSSPSLPVTSAGGAGNESIFAMQQASINWFNGSKGGFEMDTTEDNTESQSLYQDSRGCGVRSPTSELARLDRRRSHRVQLMKASLYADPDMEDDVSVSTGDQLVPMCTPLLSAAGSEPDREPAPARPADEDEDVAPATVTHVDTEEAQMPPLIVKPHTIVLQYHRKVPPFKHTIAGRLGAACAADLSVSRARHSRVGFGAAGELAYVTTHAALAPLTKLSALSELDKYLAGRGPHDWSPAAVARLSLLHPDHHYRVEEILGRQLETLIEHSEFVEPSNPDFAPRLKLRESPQERLATLRQLTKDAELYRDKKPKFGVTGAYCHEVWKLCDALWGADLENDGLPGTDDRSLADRHRRLLAWMKDAVSGVTDRDLAAAGEEDPEDENGGHIGQVWTLLLGGRVLAACRLARERRDYNLAALLAQSAGDPALRSLVSRQLSQWCASGADARVRPARRAALALLAGAAAAGDLARAHWAQALHATARYLCTPIPTLEQIIRKYEGFFRPPRDEASEEPDEEVDLTQIDGDEMGMQFPLPPYASGYDVVVSKAGGAARRVLDLRYELLRARAFGGRPEPRPHHYTRDPLDHSLCFVLGAWFGRVSARDAAAAAERLEAAGAWQLAAAALAYHPDDAARSHLIRGLVSRHAPAAADTPDLKARLEMLRKLRVPDKWVLIAQAHRAKYEHQPSIEAEHLASAEQWSAAHGVLTESLLSRAVLGDSLHQLRGLLDRLEDAKPRGWAAGGRAVRRYLQVCDQVRGLVSGPGARARGVQARLEALRPAVGAACRDLAALPARTPRDAAARAEMGAHLVQLALAAGEPARALAALLRALALPPDCTASAQYKITMELAEQASELCMEPAAGSPPAAPPRAAAAS